MTSNRVIHIVDDEEEVRRSLAFLLEMEGFATKSWASGPQFLDAAETADRGCVLLDIRMPEMDGLEVQRRLCERSLDFQLVMLTGHGDISVAVQAIKSGAVDFLEKPFERATLLAAIAEAWQRLDDTTSQNERATQAEALVARLSPRERDVLSGLLRGCANKHIAYELGISPRTVEIHRANLMAKLRVRSLSEALRIAFSAGWN